MGNRFFRGLHILAVICVAQYIAVRMYTFVHLDVAPTVVDYVLWAGIAHISIIEPFKGWYNRKREATTSSLQFQACHLANHLGVKGTPIYDDVQRMFIRHARELGESEGSDWNRILKTVLFRLSHRWGPVQSDGVILHACLQVAGIRYTLDESDQFDLGLSEMMERHASDTPEGVDTMRHRFILAQVYLQTALLSFSRLNEWLETTDSKPVQVAPSDFALAIELYCMDDEVMDITRRWNLQGGVTVGANDLFQVMLYCRRLGIDPRSLRRYLGHNGCFSFVFLRDLLNHSVVDRWVIQELTDRPDTLADLHHSEVELLVSRWKELGRPCTLAHFRQFPDDAAYLEDVRKREEELHRSASETAERRRREDQARRERAQANAPKGRKRGQSMAPESEPVEFDLLALCKALDVPTHFVALNQDILRAIVVMGLMAVGDRLPAWHKRPSLDRSKLWKRVRSAATGLDHPRRVVDETIAVLVREKVVEHSGGSYRLKDPGDALRLRNPNSHALVTSAKGLISRAKSLAS